MGRCRTRRTRFCYRRLVETMTIVKSVIPADNCFILTAAFDTHENNFVQSWNKWAKSITSELITYFMINLRIVFRLLYICVK